MKLSRWKRGAVHAWMVEKLYMIMIVAFLLLINLILLFN